MMSTWLRRNLFRTPVDGILTVVFAALSAYVLYRALDFVFVTGRWDIVQDNLKLLLVGRFPTDDLYRVAASVVALASWGGFIAGVVRARQLHAGRPVPAGWKAQTRDLVSRFWVVAAVTLLLLVMTTTIGPWLTAGLAVAGAVIGRFLGQAVGRRHLGGIGALVVGVLLAAVPVVLFFYLVAAAGFDSWEGFMLNLFLADCSIVLCFPFGVLLALGRVAGDRPAGRFNSVVAAIVLAAIPIVVYVALADPPSLSDTAAWIALAVAASGAVAGWIIGQHSTMPLVRVMSTTLIELVRGAPLFVLLLLANVALQFFVPPDLAPSKVTRAIAVFTIFTAAYMAEIVRGGLQSVPRGQYEAAKALGLSPARQTFLVVLPQALRNVIPAQIGQLISLFKDTTLAGAAMSLFDLLAVSQAITQQGEFRGQGLIGETLAFAALLFWTVSYTMSRESQRLEKRLGVGTR